jgi:hypothetical protein
LLAGNFPAAELFRQNYLAGLADVNRVSRRHQGLKRQIAPSRNHFGLPNQPLTAGCMIIVHCKDAIRPESNRPLRYG